MLRMMVVVAMTTLLGLPALNAQQPAAEPRRIYFNFRPIVELIRSGDRHVVLRHPAVTPAMGDPGAKSFVEAILDENPIIFAGRVVEKQPAFLDLRGLQDYTPAATDQATWIGSQVTVMVDRIIKTLDSVPLAEGGRFTFIDEGDATAVVNGVRVDTETEWMWPIEAGRRYLITGRIKRDQFIATGMWMEPATGGGMRSHLRASRRPGDVMPPRSPNSTLFDDWTIEEASFFLEQEVQRRGAGRR